MQQERSAGGPRFFLWLRSSREVAWSYSLHKKKEHVPSSSRHKANSTPTTPLPPLHFSCLTVRPCPLRCWTCAKNGSLTADGVDPDAEPTHTPNTLRPAHFPLRAIRKTSIRSLQAESGVLMRLIWRCFKSRPPKSPEQHRRCRRRRHHCHRCCCSNILHPIKCCF